jgi:hypothetical protein
MKKLVGLFGLLALFVVPVVAQDSSTAPQDQAPTAPAAPTEPVKVKRTYPTPKYEISGGFTYRTYYGPNASTIGMKGGYASFDYNFFRWLGLEGEVVGVSGAIKIPQLPADDIKIFTALAGPKIYPLGHRKITPFGHVLFGAGINTTAIPAFSGYPGNSSAVAVHAWEAGGGLDFNLTPHWGIHVIQFDYGVAKFLGNNIPNQSSRRVSFGIVYRFGEK